MKQKREAGLDGGLANAGQRTGNRETVLRLGDHLLVLLPDKGNKFDIMPKEGIEPSYPSGYTILSRARLPIPPLRLLEFSAQILPQP
jgi:hypothetical protein